MAFTCNYDAPQWTDFYASPMANIDDYFNAGHSELERRRTTGMDSMCGSILENLQESSPPHISPEKKGASNNATLVETNDELVPSKVAPQDKPDLSEPVEKKTLVNKNVKLNQSRARVLTSNVRRQSISRYRRRSDQYVPLAEALRKFQNGTPTRFRSNKSKVNNTAPLIKVKQTNPQLTCPMSPALRCKLRTRAVSTSSQNSQPAAKPIAKSTTFPRIFPSALQKKSTNEKPLRKIEKIPLASSSEPIATILPPKDSVTLKETDKTLNVPSSSKNENLLSSSIMSKSMRVHKTPRKKMAPTVVSTDEGMTIKEVEVLHFGIPIANVNKQITRPKPFSFETRTKELQNKKVKLKTQQEKENKIKRKTFHAKTAPSSNVVDNTLSVLKTKENDAKTNATTRTLTFKERNEIAIKKKKELMDQMYEKEEVKLKAQQEEAKKMKRKTLYAKTAPSSKVVETTCPVLKPKENNVKTNPITRTLTFKERNEIVIKKKKELMDQIHEKEKKARVFHAKPAPTFKPVFVRGNSAENLRVGEKNKIKTRGISPAARQKGQSQESLVSGNQENQAPSVANHVCPKLKIPLMTDKHKLKITTK